MPHPAPNPWVAKNPGPFRVGDRVSFEMPGRRVVGEVIEDRACLGPKGERVYAVRWRPDEWNEMVSPLLVSELQLVERADTRNGQNLTGKQ